MKNSVLQNGSWQVRPVFISSTFKDMQAERTYLQHVVFPRLEEELRKGRILLEPIDLRQGVETADIASEADREQLVLKVVLEEVNRSHPFLIVLLGDRYGWVPPEERMAAATQEMGFQTDIRDKSVTALEIEFGILQRSPEQRRRSFFYFREPLPYDQMPPEKAALFSDLYSPDALTRDRHGRLAALKQLLTDDPELASRVHHYHADWDTSKCEVTGLEAWGEVVYQHLLHELQEEIAAVASQPPQTWEDQERAALAEFIDHRRRDYTGRKQLLDNLTNIALSPTPADAVFALSSGITWGACVTGEPGSGKSALFAELVSRLSENEPGSRIRETANDSVLLLTNAAGATPRGSQVEAMLDRFIQELADVLGIANPLPENATPDDVDATFASLLGRVAVKRRVVVLLDALNQFDATPHARHMTWLRPKLWPANARIIATGLSGDPTAALSQWAGMEKLNVPPLTITDDDTDDVTAIAQAVWKRYHRQMNPSVLRVLKEKRLPDGGFAAGNPLWLTLALEQINLLDADDFARAERDFADRPAHERVTALLIDTAQRMPPTVAELYDLLLAQSERLFGLAAARAFASVIAVSRFGWRETDLLPLIPAAARVQCPDSPVPTLDDLSLAALRRSFRAHLARRGSLGQLDFFHVQMREAIKRRTLSDSEQVQALHRVVADHLESLPPGDPLRDSELMVHLIAADDPARAARFYADSAVSSEGLAAATRVLAQHIRLGAKDHPNANTAWVATLLSQSGLSNQQAANLGLRFTFDLHDALESTADLATRQTLLCAAQAAQQYIAESAPANLELLQPDLFASLIRLGDLATAQGDLIEAQRVFGEALRIAQQLAESDPANAAWQLDLGIANERLGDLSTAAGNLVDAQRHHSARHAIIQQLVDSDPTKAVWQRDLSVSLNKLGNLAIAHGNSGAARRLFADALCITQRLAASDPANAAWQRDLWMLFGKLGELASAQNDLPDAQKQWDNAYRITQQLAMSDPDNAAWQRDLSVSLNKLGELAMKKGNLSDAQRLFGESHRIRQRLAASDAANAAWQRDLSVSFEKLGDVAFAQGYLLDARRLFDESHCIAHRLATSDPTNAAWQRDLAASFEKLRNLAKTQGHRPEPGRFSGEDLCISQALADPDSDNSELQSELSMSLNNLGDKALAMGNLPEAQRLYSESFRIRQQLADSNPMSFAPRKIASSWWQRIWLRIVGTLSKKPTLILRSERRRSEQWQRDLSISFTKLGDVAMAKESLPEAQRLYSESLRISQLLVESDPANAAWQRDLSASLERLGDLARADGGWSLSKAQRLISESLGIRLRLVKSDPANAEWQRDLAVSHYKLARIAHENGEEARFDWELGRCFSVLDQMHARGLPFDSEMAGVYRELNGKYGSSRQT